MPVRGEDATERRRRRSPEMAQREIVGAAEGLLRERPYREFSVDEVMRRTGLSRPSFYVYFRDRHDLVLRVVEHMEDELRGVASRWLESAGGGPAVLRQALEGMVAVYGDHGPVLRALADAAVEDPQVEQAYGALVQRFIDVTARHIREELSAGHIAPVDPKETAKALIWMTERYLYHSFGTVHRAPAGRVQETLARMWTRTLYQSP